MLNQMAFAVYYKRMKKVTRLFDGFAPKNYNIHINLDPEAKKFGGQVTISGRKTGRPSHRLTFHQKDLKIKSAKLTKHDKSGDIELVVDRINTHQAYEELRLHSKDVIYPGEYSVTIEFEAKITDPMNGLYPCYFNHDNQDKILLATQFESHHAREVLPCIDEPEAKATFDLSLTTPAGNAVIANTPVKKQETRDKRLETSFETTPVMSTYLLAFAYGDIGYLETKTNRGTVIRTYATPNNVQYTDFALDVAKKCLEFYEDYFNIDYPLEKLDMIALPDFSSGAMENWGLITYREQTLLVDPKNTSTGVKQFVAMVVAHELAHQWFGNLVTMRWWTDLWLNEGFASWIEYLAVDKLFPDWQMWTQFVSSEQQPSLKLDSLDNTHPVEVDINHPDEIRSIFDGISYGKGASVIHMLYGYLGEDNFRDGLRHYLKKHEYANAETKDLWASFEHISGKPVKEFMHAWTSLPGFPIVKATKDGQDIKLHQERYYLSRPEKTASSLWPIPLLDNKIKSEIFKDRNHSYHTSAFGKLNQSQSGFYRTIYGADLLSGLLEIFDEFGTEDKLGILSDAFEASKAFYTSTTDALKLLPSYSAETSAPIWDVIAGNLGEIRRVMDDDELRELIKPFIKNIAEKQYKRLGWTESKSDSYFDSLLRPTILGLMTSSDDKDSVDQAMSMFNKAKSMEELPADLRSVILVTSARHGDKKTFDKLLKLHNTSSNSEDKLTISAAMTSFKQPELIDGALSLINGPDVRRQDAMYWIVYSFMNRHAKDRTWQWMKDNWAWMQKEMGTDLSFFRTPIYAARSFSNKEFLAEYDEFFAKVTSPALDRSIKQGHEMLDWQIKWREKDLESIKKFLG